MLHKYLTLTFTLKFSTKGDASWRCRGEAGERGTGLGKAAPTWGPCIRGLGQRGSSHGLKQSPFWATSVPLSNCPSATCHRCAQRVPSQQSSCCDRRAGEASLQGRRGGQGAAAGATAQSATTPGQRRLLAGR